MGASGLVFDELASQIARNAVAEIGESRMEPIWDRNNGGQGGILVDSPLERVLIFSRAQSALSLPTLSQMRRMMTRARARRALLYMPIDASIADPVMLMATLSKIKIVRVVTASSL